MELSKGLVSALSLLPEKLSQEILALSHQLLCNMTEIRLRTNAAAVLVVGNELHPVIGSPVTKAELENVVSKAFRNSIHNNMAKYRSGCITYDNGCRVGFCGTFYSADSISTIRDISSVNIRIPHEVIGCSRKLFDECFSRRPSSLILFGAPSSGKTTYLRDLARLCGNRYKVSLIDERGELAASSCAIAGCDVGRYTDVFSGYPRHEAIITAVRVMSPQILICDETGTCEDADALEYTVASGVKVVISCHCTSFEELNTKKYLRFLIDRSVFDYAAALCERKLVGIYSLTMQPCSV